MKNVEVIFKNYYYTYSYVTYFKRGKLYLIKRNLAAFSPMRRFLSGSFLRPAALNNCLLGTLAGGALRYLRTRSDNLSYFNLVFHQSIEFFLEICLQLSLNRLMRMLKMMQIIRICECKHS